MTSIAKDASLVQEMKIRIERLETQVENLHQSRHKSELFSDDQAKEQIENYLSQKKMEGKTKISLLDISLDLHLPVSQVEPIMEKLKHKGIREVE
ncbi:MAG: hypothetical protein Q8P05_03125 [Candidatus Diapherotrites archaeon]|nr:hypothetical protein [Candidatus Diapherotrites archaeon]MDZ4256168.1 hypothetical protein [archaeon]